MNGPFPPLLATPRVSDESLVLNVSAQGVLIGRVEQMGGCVGASPMRTSQPRSQFRAGHCLGRDFLAEDVGNQAWSLLSSRWPLCLHATAAETERYQTTSTAIWSV